MLAINIPRDRNVLVDLAIEILKKNAAMSRKHGVTVPRKFVATLRERAETPQE